MTHLFLSAFRFLPLVQTAHSRSTTRKFLHDCFQSSQQVCFLIGSNPPVFASKVSAFPALLFSVDFWKHSVIRMQISSFRKCTFHGSSVGELGMPSSDHASFEQGSRDFKCHCDPLLWAMILSLDDPSMLTENSRKAHSPQIVSFHVRDEKKDTHTRTREHTHTQTRIHTHT